MCNICNDIVADDDRVQHLLNDDRQTQESPTPTAPPPTNKAACSRCGNSISPTELLEISGRGALGGQCADAVEDALNQGRPMS